MTENTIQLVINNLNNKPMKNLIILLLLALFTSCNREENTPQPANINPMHFTPTGNPDDFRAIGTCYAPIPPSTNYPSWINNDYVDIYDQNGQSWIDSLNYVITQALPITMISNESFTFNDYTIPNFHIVGGNGYVSNDTLYVTVNANKLSGCTDQFTFYGKYTR